ncbi:C-X-C motif chemokine 11-6-like [Trichomycterus rosablanca]|uniref:C-X-C motif chemokine 11-6-like n=1 Tax=Trichomycterus rosablanca TaxID=2290929 RepID=UPI002F35927B
MKSAVVFGVIVCVGLLIVHVQGQARTSVSRCLCRGFGLNHVRLQLIDKVEIYPASPSCDKVEVIVVMKNGKVKKCLNPESKSAKNYIKKALQKRTKLMENTTD